MPMFDFECVNGHVHEELTPHTVEQRECPVCHQPANRVLLKAPAIGWLAMGSQKNVSPEFIDRFEHMHKQQKAKEKKSLEEHGDYGPRPGAD